MVTSDHKLALKQILNIFYDISEKTSSVAGNSDLALAKIEVEIAKGERKMIQAEGLPEIALGYFVQSMHGTQEKNGIDLEVCNSLQFQGL